MSASLQVPLRIAQHILFHNGDDHLGLQPGQFVIRLMRLMDIADEGNRRRLTTAYPEYAIPFFAAKYTSDGMNSLRDIVKAAEAGS